MTMGSQLKLFILKSNTSPSADYKIHDFKLGNVVGVFYDANSQELRSMIENVTRYGLSQLLMVPRYYCGLLTASKEIKQFKIRRIEFKVEPDEDTKRLLFDFSRGGSETQLAELFYDYGVSQLSADVGDSIVNFYDNGMVHISADNPDYQLLDAIISRMVSP